MIILASSNLQILQIIMRSMDYRDYIKRIRIFFLARLDNAPEVNFAIFI